MVIDPKTEFKLSKVCPDVADRWKKAAQDLFSEHGKQIKITDGFRSFSEQWNLWGKGRLKDKNGTWVICDSKLIVTHAMPGQSLHQYGLALDSCFVGDDPYLAKLPHKEADLLWEAYGKACKTHGMEWGGDWVGPKNDRPHCQITYGLSIHTFQMAYEEGGIKSVWDKCKNTMMCGGELS